VKNGGYPALSADWYDFLLRRADRFQAAFAELTIVGAIRPDFPNPEHAPITAAV